jgi:hypothetical protein
MNARDDDHPNLAPFTHPHHHEAIPASRAGSIELTRTAPFNIANNVVL